MKDNNDPRDQIIEKMVTAFDSLMDRVHSGVQPSDDDPAVRDAKIALGTGKIYLTAKRDVDAASRGQEPLNELLEALVSRGRKS